MRRSAASFIGCVLAARLLAACGDGSVSGPEMPADDGGTRRDPITSRDADPDAWSELTDDLGRKGDKGDASFDDAPSDASARDGSNLPDPCTTRDDGTYCAALLGLPSTGLLRCTSRRSGAVTACPGGCLDRTGATDACLDDAVDPCFNETDGLYCGRTIGASARPNDAFRCMFRRTTFMGPCNGGCAMGPGGITCNP